MQKISYLQHNSFGKVVDDDIEDLGEMGRTLLLLIGRVWALNDAMGYTASNRKILDVAHCIVSSDDSKSENM